MQLTKKLKTVNLLFQHGFIPVINKPTRVTKRNATVIDHVITNNFYNTTFKTGIIKARIADHFPIFLVSDNNDTNIQNETKTIFKRQINEISIHTFQTLLTEETDWQLVFQTSDANEAYDIFLKLFLKQYEKAFPKVEIKKLKKTLLSPWMTTGLLKSSKKKQKLYDKFLKRRTYTNEKKYKNYNKYFEVIKSKSKRLYYLL